MGRARRLISRTTGSGARQGLVKIVGATGAGHLIALAFAPVISRLYSPEVFGPFAVINSVVLTVAVVSTFRYELAIPIPRRDQEAQALAAVGVTLAAIVGVSGTIVVSLWSSEIVDLFRLTTTVEPFLIWVPVIAGFMGLFIVLNQLAIRAKLYGAIAQRNFTLAVVVTAAQVAAGLAGMGTHGLAGGLALGQFVGVISLAYSLRKQPFRPIRIRRLPALASRYRVFPLLMTPSGLINTLGLQAPIILAAALLGTQEAGWLGMTMRLIVLPVALIGVAVSQVFLGEFAAARRDGHAVTTLFMTASRRLAVVGLGVTAVLLFLAPTLFPLVLGEQWSQSGVYAQALALGAGAQMVASPLSQTLVVMGKQIWQALWDVARLVLIVGAFTAVAHHGQDVLTMWVIGVTTAVTYGGLWLLSWSAVRRGVRDVS